MTLFTKGGSLPGPVPFADLDGGGDTWTNLADSPLGRAACGWETAPPAPDFDPALQRLEWIDGMWAVSDFSPEELAAAREARRQARIDELAEYRWQRQRGFTFAGQAMPSDVETIALVAAKIKVMQQRGDPPTASFTWKPARGLFVSLTLAALIAYGDAIDIHVQACFDREMALYAALLAAADPDAVDIAAGWP